MVTTKTDRSEKMRSKARLAKVSKALDGARAKHAPEPAAVQFALLQWWDYFASEVNGALGVLGRFRCAMDEGKFLDGFEFADDATFQLLAIQEAIDNARPELEHITAGELGKAVRNLDTKGVMI